MRNIERNAFMSKKCIPYKNCNWSIPKLNSVQYFRYKQRDWPRVTQCQCGGGEQQTTNQPHTNVSNMNFPLQQSSMLRLHGMHTLHIDRFYKINYNTIRMMLSFTHLNPPHLIYCVRNMDVDPKECIFSLRIFVEFLCDDVCVGFSVSFIPV